MLSFLSGAAVANTRVCSLRGKAKMVLLPPAGFVHPFHVGLPDGGGHFGDRLFEGRRSPSVPPRRWWRQRKPEGKRGQTVLIDHGAIAPWSIISPPSLGASCDSTSAMATITQLHHASEGPVTLGSMARCPSRFLVSWPISIAPVSTDPQF